MAERFVCTAERPWTENDGLVSHPDAVTLYTEEGPLATGGDYDRMECPYCNHRFWVNLPN